MKNNHKLISLFITFLVAVFLLVSCGAETSAGPSNLARQPDAPTNPDLTINSFTINGSTTPDRVGQGQSIGLRVAGSNLGEGRSEIGEVVFYRSDDQNIDTRADDVVGRTELEAIEGGEEWSKVISVSASDTIGNHYYGACVEV